MKRLLALIGGLLLVLGVGSYWFLWTGAGPAQGAHTIVVKEGTSLYRLAGQLDAMGLIPGNARTYRVMARLFGSKDPIQAGEFQIPARTGGARLLDILQHGQPVQRLVTIPEGMPSILVYEKVMTTPFLTGSVAVPEEGSVLPDSYSYERGESRSELLRRMQLAMARTLDKLWAERKPTSAVASKRDAIILASIVEKETGKASERRMVAGVYSNRLRQGMKLDADPTVIYPVTKGKPLGRRILLSELHADNGYNTYAKAGLPAGPITNPGRASIAAVLDPAPTDALYFVADGTGGHAFAATLAEQEANRRKWYEIRRQRGEM